MSFWWHRFDQNSNKNSLRISDLKIFVASWGLPRSFLGLPRDLVSIIIIKEAYRKPRKASRKPQGMYTNFQGRYPHNIFVVFFLVETITPKRHIGINWPLFLYEIITLRVIVKLKIELVFRAILKHIIIVRIMNNFLVYDSIDFQISKCQLFDLYTEARTS